MKSFIILSLIIFSGILYSQSPYTNVLISSAGGPNEVSICVNPKNTNQLVAGANINLYYYSSNGGTSWTAGSLSSSLYGVWGDPIIVCDTASSFYFFHLSNPPSGQGHWIDRIVSQKSTNAGVTWTNPGSYMGFNLSNSQAQQDKHGIGIDFTHGPRGNWIYCTWTEFDLYGTSNPNDSSKIMFSRSTDAGNSWSTAVRLSKKAGDCWDSDLTMEGAVPCVGPNGELYVAWSGPLALNNYKIFFNRSLDGGNTWLPIETVAATQRGGWDYAVNGIYRNNGLPCTLCDVSNGPYRGTIFVNYTDSVANNDHDVMIIKSTDQGTTWSAPIRVNDDAPGKEQFFSWMAIDPVTGYDYIVFYDRRNYTNNLSTDVFLARSTDGGNTWINERISESPFSPNQGTFFGDYNGITAYNGHVRPIWTRLASGVLSIWTALIDFPVGVEAIGNEVPKEFSLHQNYPNPFNPSTKIKFDLPGNSNSHITMKIYDILGNVVKELVDANMKPGSYEVAWDASNQSSGIYFYTIESGNFKETKKMILTK